VEQEGEYTLGESLTEGKWTFGGQTVRSSMVAVGVEREEREGRKKEGGGRKAGQNIMDPKGASLASARWRPPVHRGAARLPRLHPRAPP
jgi:hypothetical protein